MRRLLTPGAVCALALLLTPAPASAEAQVPPSGEKSAPETGLKGSLLGPNYEPLTGYKLRFRAESGQVFESGPIDVRGRFVVSQLPPGSYEVRLVTGDGRPCEAAIPPVEIAGTAASLVTTILPRMPVCEPAPKPEPPPEPEPEPPPRKEPPPEPPPKTTPPPEAAPPASPGPPVDPGRAGGMSSSTKTWIIVGSIVGAVGVGLLLDDDDDPPPVSPMMP